MNSDYQRIEKAITYLQAGSVSQPSLQQVARAVHLSPAHFQRLFKRWAGVSPKRYLQYLTVEHAKTLLHEHSVLDTALAVGLSAPSRLHDHFIAVEAATPGQFKTAGAGLRLRHGVAQTPFGTVWLASSEYGICAMEFADRSAWGGCLRRLQQRWPRAVMRQDNSHAVELAAAVFHRADNAPLHVAGSNFQLQVWKALLAVPAGQVCSYRQLAQAIGRPRASRAVAMAVGSNPLAVLIPCHRVLRSNGELSGYRWGPARKAALLAWESMQGDGAR